MLLGTLAARKFIKNKNIITNIYRIEAYDSIMCRSNNVLSNVLDLVLKGKSLLEYTDLFSPNEYK